MPNKNCWYAVVAKRLAARGREKIAELLKAGATVADDMAPKKSVRRLVVGTHEADWRPINDVIRDAAVDMLVGELSASWDIAN